MPEATKTQNLIAMRFDIPQEYAHTINMEKFGKFMEYYWSPAGKVERALHDISLWNMQLRQREWL